MPLLFYCTFAFKAFIIVVIILFHAILLPTCSNYFSQTQQKRRMIRWSMIHIFKIKPTTKSSKEVHHFVVITFVPSCYTQIWCEILCRVSSYLLLEWETISNPKRVIRHCKHWCLEFHFSIVMWIKLWLNYVRLWIVARLKLFLLVFFDFVVLFYII